MGNICPCFKRSRQKPLTYDVHQETFQIDDNHQNIGENSPKNHNREHDNNILTQQLRNSEASNDRSADHDDYHPIQPIPPINEYTNKQTEKGLSTQILLAAKLESETAEIQKLIQSQTKIEQKKMEQPPKFIANILTPKAPRKKYNPDDYRFINETGVFKVKKIDSIKEQQFNIQNCNDCYFFIFDITANLYIDDTNNCFVFIAPCQSTIFVRNCKNLTIVAATKQFRTYQCHNSTFSLYCKSQPVIESSSELVFTSFTCPIYTQLCQQLRKKRLQPWNNHWSQIHNFTKKQGQRHYKLEERIDFSSIDWKRAFEEAGLEIISTQNPIPLIIGDLHYEIKRQILIMIKNIEDQTILKALNGSVILKGFQGVIAGQGKQEKKVLLIDALDNIVEKYEQLGTVYQNPQQIEINKSKCFISFGDQREK